MKVVFHENFYQPYANDAAAAPGRLEPVVSELKDEVDWVTAEPATAGQITAAHASRHIECVRDWGLYDIAALAAGAAYQTARIGLTEPSFGLIRPPGHHASPDWTWGYCYFNNMAVALLTLKNDDKIDSAAILDIDLHYGDGTQKILGDQDWASMYNPFSSTCAEYLEAVQNFLDSTAADIFGICAGFDHHRDDWGGLLRTEDYKAIGQMVREAAQKNSAGSFGLLEGGYNPPVLAKSLKAFLQGLQGNPCLA